MSTRKGCDRVSRRLATSFLLCGLFALFAGCTPLSSVPQGAKDSAAAGHRRIDAKDASISITVPDSWSETQIDSRLVLAVRSADGKSALAIRRLEAPDGTLDKAVDERIEQKYGSAVEGSLRIKESRHFYAYDPPIPMSVARYEYIDVQRGGRQVTIVGTIAAPGVTFEIVAWTPAAASDEETCVAAIRSAELREHPRQVFP